MDSYSNQVQTAAAVLGGTVSFGVISAFVVTLLGRMKRQVCIRQALTPEFHLNAFVESFEKPN